MGERLGSGDGERKTLLTRQIAFEPLPASVLFGLGVVVDHVSGIQILMLGSVELNHAINQSLLFAVGEQARPLGVRAKILHV